MPRELDLLHAEHGRVGLRTVMSGIGLAATMTSLVLGGFVALACAAGCSSRRPPPEATTASSSPIQGGTSDTTHSFAVAVIIEQDGGGVVLCSGALLAPNLVATARHCVAPITSTVSGGIDCATSTFGSVTAASNLAVTTDPTVSASSPVQSVSEIIVPSGSNETLVCGNDLALLILSQAVTLAQYVTPVISPPMTDHRAYTTTVTAIGYGIATPSDTTGVTSGIRRIKENVDLVCIPNDTSFDDCFPLGSQQISANEFVSGNATCGGDSGSSAFEQRNFNSGNWLSFGVLSRGGVDTDGGTCLQGTYTRFDAWGPLLVDAANRAASLAGYSPPGWASAWSQAVDAGDDSSSPGAESGLSSAPEGGPLADVEGGAFEDGDDGSRGSEGGSPAVGEGGASDDGEGGPPAGADSGPPLTSDSGAPSAPDGGPPSSTEDSGACSPNGAQCNDNRVCCSSNCLSGDEGVTFLCVPCGIRSPCDTGYACHEGMCTLTADGGGSAANSNQMQSTGSIAAKGCSCGIVGARPAKPMPWRETPAGFFFAALWLARRRRGLSPPTGRTPFRAKSPFHSKASPPQSPPSA